LRTAKVVAKFVRVECECGEHLVNLLDPKWKKKRDKYSASTCVDCGKPLVCRGEDGHFYFVGKRIE